MEDLKTIVGSWGTKIEEEWAIDIEPDRKVFLRNKILYAGLKQAAKSFLYYLDAPNYREQALASAIVYREFANCFMDDKTDFEKIAISICNGILASEDETQLPEKPEWYTDEEWAQGQEDATHDEAGDLVRPKVEGFITGAFYDKPCIFPSEFDGDNARRVVRACMQSVLLKCEQDNTKCVRSLARAHTTRSVTYWTNQGFGAKQALTETQNFVNRYDLHWDE
jgi:hypothetical protein